MDLEHFYKHILDDAKMAHVFMPVCTSKIEWDVFYVPSILEMIMQDSRSFEIFLPMDKILCRLLSVIWTMEKGMKELNNEISDEVIRFINTNIDVERDEMDASSKVGGDYSRERTLAMVKSYEKRALRCWVALKLHNHAINSFTDAGLYLEKAIKLFGTIELVPATTNRSLVDDLEGKREHCRRTRELFDEKMSCLQQEEPCRRTRMSSGTEDDEMDYGMDSFNIM